MTVRWRVLLVTSVLAGALAWRLAWPELMGLASAGVVVAVAVRLWWGSAPDGEIEVERAAELIPRLSDATVPVVVDWRRPPARDWASFGTAVATDPRVWVPIDAGVHRVPWPIDTRHRGRQEVGPTDLSYADPFALIVRRVADATPSTTTVIPRTVATPPMIRSRGAGDSLEGVRAGHEHFHTLREYSFGDEPRTIHWRSSARAGTLLVKVSVDPADEQTLIVLDLDRAAYSPPSALFDAQDAALFEDAVDLAHSLAVAAAGPGLVSHVMTTGVGAPPVKVDATHQHAGAVLLAGVSPLVAAEVNAQAVSVMLRRTSVRELLVVSGYPQPKLLAAVAGWRRLVGIVRVVSPVDARAGGTS